MNLLPPFARFGTLSLLALLLGMAACNGDAERAAESSWRGTNETLSLSGRILDGASMDFVPHAGKGPLDSWLGWNLPSQPADDLRHELEVHLRTHGQLGAQASLRGRDEAHITVITPPEFDKVLRPFVTMEEINDMARGAGNRAGELPLQQMSFAVHSLGRAQARIDKKLQATYYVIVESPDLLALRQRIFELYRERGGEPSQFDPATFYPHVTIAFSERDLHIADNVYKGKNSSFLGVRLVK
jgi:hypothetical protein